MKTAIVVVTLALGMVPAFASSLTQLTPTQTSFGCPEGGPTDPYPCPPVPLQAK